MYWLFCILFTRPFLLLPPSQCYPKWEGLLLAFLFHINKNSREKKSEQYSGLGYVVSWKPLTGWGALSLIYMSKPWFVQQGSTEFYTIVTCWKKKKQTISFSFISTFVNSSPKLKIAGTESNLLLLLLAYTVLWHWDIPHTGLRASWRAEPGG